MNNDKYRPRKTLFIKGDLLDNNSDSIYYLRFRGSKFKGSEVDSFMMLTQ